MCSLRLETFDLFLFSSYSDFKVVDNTTLPYDEAIRRVERGSKIVLAVHYATNLILQVNLIFLLIGTLALKSS